MAFSVPEYHYRAVEILTGSSVELLNSIEKALQETPPYLLRRDLGNSLEKKTDLDSEKGTEVTSLLVSLFLAFTRTNLSLEKFTDEIVRAMEQVDRPSMKPENDDWSNIKAFLLKVLSLESTLGATAKALDLMISNERRYCRARIVSDLRPIFRNDPTKPPVANVIIHNLELVYHPAETADEPEKFFIAMDISDLHSLKKVIQRSIDKHKSLRDLCDSVKFQCIGEEEK